VLLLLDTHVWIWSAQGDAGRIGRLTRRLLTKAEPEEAIAVSAISLFELTALHTLGRIRLTRRPEQWIRDSLDLSGLRVFDIAPAAAIDAGGISRTALADPIDRLLVASARHRGATLVTADERVLAYAQSAGDVRVQDARR